MARMGKVQEYAVRWLNSQGSNNEQIAEELKLTEKQVARVLEKTNEVNKENSIKTNTSPVTKITSKELMIRHTSAKKNNSVAIMTKEASEMNDQSKKNNQSHPSFQKNIFRPNG
jgi:hypothetical protein